MITRPCGLRRADNKQFKLCLVDILGLCTDISKLLLGTVTVSHRRINSVVYLCLSFVYCTTRDREDIFPDYFQIPGLFHVFQVGGHPHATVSAVPRQCNCRYLTSLCQQYSMHKVMVG